MRRHHAHQQVQRDAGGRGADASSSSANKGDSSSVGNGGLSPFKNPPTSRKPTALKPVAKPLDLGTIQATKTEKRDMFGRVISAAAHMSKARGIKRPAGLMENKEESEVLPVRFKFHEGVTDAVRRPVKVRDLL